MSTTALVAVIAGVAAILSALVGAIRFVFQAPLIAQNARLEGERAAIENERERDRELLVEAENERDRERGLLAEADARYKGLQQDFVNLKLDKTGVLLKRDIDGDLLVAMEALDVKESSILVPGPPPNASSFIFLSIYGPAAAKLRKAKLALGKGIVGRVFATGKIHNIVDAYSDPHFYDGIDRKGEHETRALLTLPLQHGNVTIGVVQFLNKPGGFSREDERHAEALIRPMAAKAAAFVSDPENFGLLGLAWGSEEREATIVFCDLTSSSSLLAQMNVPSAIDCINEYLEQQCRIAMGFGATIDKYTGDGVMLRFNVPLPLPLGDHAKCAVDSALAMRRAYDQLKESWLTEGLPVGAVYSRIGLSCGTVYEAKIGHPQFQHLTVIGEPVNRAANMCEVGSRDRSVIVGDESLIDELDGAFATREVVTEAEGQRAYEFLEQS